MTTRVYTDEAATFALYPMDEPVWIRRGKQHVLYWPQLPFVHRYQVGHVERWSRKRNMWIARHDYTPNAKLCDTFEEAKAWVVAMQRLTRG